MKVITTAAEMQQLLLAIKPKRIGFVPTMGCLHQGHLTLIEKSTKYDDVTVCSIFVNPSQFNNPEDFQKYPVTLEADRALLEQYSCDYLFLPDVNEIYPPGYQPVLFDIGKLDTIWEGEHRPGHFQGVCNVMNRLLEIIPADDLWMGQKDLQQCLVIQKLMNSTGRKNVFFHRVDTIRENSGLAMSSRNTRLRKEALAAAAALYDALQLIRRQYRFVPFSQLLAKAHEQLLQHGFEKVEYIAIARENDLAAMNEYVAEEKYAAIAAAWIEGVRLIDNIIL